MTIADNPDSLGPLPRVDRNAVLQNLSISAFQSALRPDRFVFREETKDDFGVDGSLELRIRSGATNLRSHVQLKSTDSEKANADGSISVQVRTSNLNYLLNGISPIYVLYIAPKSELRFVWARDERRRIEADKPDWLEQESLTIRFRHILTEEALEEIHERIRQEALFQRRVFDTLAGVSSAEYVRISINPESLRITD